MSYEINIIAINQKKPIHIEGASEILLQNEIEDFGVDRYFEIRPFFSNTPGILYTLVTKMDEEYFSSYEICDSDFGVIPEDKSFMWLPEGTIEDLTPLIIKDKFYDEFVDIIYRLLESAPQKRVLFQTRYQGRDEEVVLGVIKMSKFINMLSKKEILFNVCYILEAD